MTFQAESLHNENLTTHQRYKHIREHPATSHIGGIAQSPCTPTRRCCRIPATNGGSHSTVTLAAQSMASFIRAVALRLAAALSASGAASCFTAACRAAVLPLVLTTCGSKVQWHESRPLVYCMLPKALDSWASSVSPSSS